MINYRFIAPIPEAPIGDGAFFMVTAIKALVGRLKGGRYPA